MCLSVYYFVREQLKLLVTFSPIFVADAKIIFGYNVEAPLNYCIYNIVEGKCSIIEGRCSNI